MATRLNLQVPASPGARTPQRFSVPFLSTRDLSSPSPGRQPQRPLATPVSQPGMPAAALSPSRRQQTPLAATMGREYASKLPASRRYPVVQQAAIPVYIVNEEAEAAEAVKPDEPAESAESSEPYNESSTQALLSELEAYKRAVDEKIARAFQRQRENAKAASEKLEEKGRENENPVKFYQPRRNSNNSLIRSNFDVLSPHQQIRRLFDLNAVRGRGAVEETMENPVFRPVMSEAGEYQKSQNQNQNQSVTSPRQSAAAAESVQSPRSQPSSSSGDSDLRAQVARLTQALENLTANPRPDYVQAHTQSRVIYNQNGRSLNGKSSRMKKENPLEILFPQGSGGQREDGGGAEETFSGPSEEEEGKYMESPMESAGRFPPAPIFEAFPPGSPNAMPSLPSTILSSEIEKLHSPQFHRYYSSELHNLFQHRHPVTAADLLAARYYRENSERLVEKEMMELARLEMKKQHDHKEILEGKRILLENIQLQQLQASQPAQQRLQPPTPMPTAQASPLASQGFPAQTPRGSTPAARWLPSPRQTPRTSSNQ